MKKKLPQLIDISVLVKFEDGIRAMALKEATRNAPLEEGKNLITKNKQ